MKYRNGQFALALMFFVFAVVFSVLFWAEVSIAVKVGLFAFGFGSGVMFGGWIAYRNQLQNC